MSNQSQHIAQLQKAQQRLHREELKLARLRTAANESRRADARLKLRLGNLLFTMQWETLPEEKLSSILSEICKQLNDPETDTEGLRIKGENAFRLMANRKRLAKSSTRSSLNEETRRKINHRKIVLGGLVIKQGLKPYTTAVLLGAFINQNEGSGQEP